MAVNLQKINSEVNNLESTSIIEMFELDLTPFNVGVFRFHPGTNGIQTNIVWQGDEYQSLPIEMDGMEVKADGTLSRPILRVANIDGVISRVIGSYDDLIGLKVRRKRTYLKYLDAENFEGSDNPYGTPDPNSHFLDEIFSINQKKTEAPEFIEFELVSAIELENVQLPARQVLSNFCPFSYRGYACGYTGPPVATDSDLIFQGSTGNHLGLTINSDMNADLSWQQSGIYSSGDVVSMESFDKSKRIFFVCTPTGGSISKSDPRLDSINWKADSCSKSVYGCYLRFSGDAHGKGIPFGGFPGTKRFNLR